MIRYIKENFFEIFRYGLVGLSSAFSYWGISNLVSLLNSPSWFSASLGWLISVLVSYFGHIYITYRVESEHKKRSWRFLVLCGINWAVSVSLTLLFHDILNLSYSVTSGIVVFIIPLISYPIGKYWVFQKRSKDENLEEIPHSNS